MLLNCMFLLSLQWPHVCWTFLAVPSSQRNSYWTLIAMNDQRRHLTAYTRPFSHYITSKTVDTGLRYVPLYDVTFYNTITLRFVTLYSVLVATVWLILASFWNTRSCFISALNSVGRGWSHYDAHCIGMYRGQFLFYRWDTRQIPGTGWLTGTFIQL